MKRLIRYFSDPYRLMALNAICVLAAVIANIYWQVFCIPVLWASVVLLVCFVHTIIYPVLYRSQRLAPLVGFIGGVSFMVYLYCILFLWHMNLLGLIMLLAFGAGIITYIPHFFAVQLFYKSVIRPAFKSHRYFFLAGIVFCISMAFYAGAKFGEAAEAINRSARGGYKQLERGYMTERILGIGFLYHLSFCEYDGWRPPLHDPALVVGILFNTGPRPPRMELEQALALYRKFYPERKYKLDCSCAIEYSDNYHNDELWK